MDVEWAAHLFNHSETHPYGPTGKYNSDLDVAGKIFIDIKPLRPDLIIRDRKNKRIFLLDVKVPYVSADCFEYNRNFNNDKAGPLAIDSHSRCD